jgi:hypothetical protein
MPIFCCFTIFSCSPRCLSFCCFSIFMFVPRCHLFVTSRYFRFHRDTFFCCATIFMFVPRCHLLLLHDISESTAMLSFVAPRYFWIHHDAIFLLHHDSFWFARNPFAQILLTIRLTGAASKRKFIWKTSVQVTTKLKFMHGSPRPVEPVSRYLVLSRFISFISFISFSYLVSLEY